MDMHFEDGRVRRAIFERPRRERIPMKATFPTLTALFVLAGTAIAQEQDPVFYRPAQALRKLYYKLSHAP